MRLLLLSPEEHFGLRAYQGGEMDPGIAHRNAK
jgi:hypothetical protein